MQHGELTSAWTMDLKPLLCLSSRPGLSEHLMFWSPFFSSASWGSTSLISKWKPSITTCLRLLRSVNHRQQACLTAANSILHQHNNVNAEDFVTAPTKYKSKGYKSRNNWLFLKCNWPMFVKEISSRGQKEKMLKVYVTCFPDVVSAHPLEKRRSNSFTWNKWTVGTTLQK